MAHRSRVPVTRLPPPSPTKRQPVSHSHSPFSTSHQGDCISSYTHYATCKHDSGTGVQRGICCSRCALRGQPCTPPNPVCVTMNGRCPACQLQRGHDNYDRNNNHEGDEGDGGGTRGPRSQHTWDSVLKGNTRLGPAPERPQYHISGSAAQHPEDDNRGRSQRRERRRQ